MTGPDLSTSPRPPASTATARTSPADARQQAAADRERQQREDKLRAGEERVRRLVRDICTGCDYGPPKRAGDTAVKANE